MEQWDAVAGAVGDALVLAVLLLAVLGATRWLLGRLLASLARLPGSVGRAAAGAARSIRPGLARRLVAATLGLGSPVVAAVGTLPTASAVVVDRADAARGPALAAPEAATLGTAPHHRAASGTGPRRQVHDVVVVRRGDTLWDIARRHLPPTATDTDVARAWPRWYAANRAAIGPDPALLRPGTRLRSPDRRPAGTPASSHDRPSATRTGPGAVARSLDPDRR